MRYLVIALVVHTLVLAWLHNPRSGVLVRERAEASVPAAAEPLVVVEVLTEGGGGSLGGAVEPDTEFGCGRVTEIVVPQIVEVGYAGAERVRVPAENAWDQVAMSVDRTPAHSNGDGSGGGGGSGHASGNGVGNGNGNGNGSGDGNGNGNGNGIGFGNGGGVRVPDDVPPPPPPPGPVAEISKARPARLVFPSRDREVEDEADLFVARITVDTDGDVVGARMIKTRPGARGDQASDAIWSFRYLPALDDDGRPIVSTFEQPFQIR